jgi:hypothetical protein
MPQMSSVLQKLKWNMPWLLRYPSSRISSLFGRNAFEKKHVVIMVANHFEPSWKSKGQHDLENQIRVLEEYHKLSTKTCNAIIGADGVKFQHTNFYPIEQYDRRLLDIVAQMQADGLGEAEIHLHHGIEKPDTPANLRSVLIEGRDRLAQNHKLLSRFDAKGEPKYAFVHGNLALGNSRGGHFCGVDNEMEILAETGCYADFTYPSAPDQSQVPIINKIYECGLPMDQPIPHRKGQSISVGHDELRLPIIFQGPLMMNWTRTIKGFPFPRIDDGALVSNQPSDLQRYRRWINANVTVAGKSDWVFIKLYCHGFFTHDQSACIGEGAEKFFNEILENSEKTAAFNVYFASAREAFNMVSAAADGKTGSPGDYRNYRLKTIMDE